VGGIAIPLKFPQLDDEVEGRADLEKEVVLLEDEGRLPRGAAGGDGVCGRGSWRAPSRAMPVWWGFVPGCGTCGDGGMRH